MGLERSWVGVALPVVAGVVLGAISAGCGGSNSSTEPTTVPAAVSEQDLAGNPGSHVSLQSLVVLDLEREGVQRNGDTDEPGSDRIPYRLPNDTRMTVEVDPADELYITLISSATGRLVMDVGPDNPSFDADLPAGDYDLYIHSNQTADESIAVFARPEKRETRDAFGSWWKVNFGRNCAGCDMRGGQYKWNNWKGVNIEGADLTGADLTGTNMENVRAAGANFTDVWMQEVYAVRTDFSRATFTKTKFLSGDASGAIFNMTKFDDALFQHSVLKEANFSHSTAKDLIIIRSPLERVNLLLAKWSNCEITDSPITDSQASEWTLDDSSLFKSHLKNCFLYKMSARKTVFNYVTVEGGNLDYANWEGANLNWGELVQTRIRNANLRNIWWRARLYICDASGSDFRSPRYGQPPTIYLGNTTGALF